MSKPPNKIHDEFAERPISRQRKYQLRHKKLGLCSLCKEKAVMNNRCLKHQWYLREWTHKKRGFKTWRLNTKFTRLLAQQQKEQQHEIHSNGNVGQPAHLAEVQAGGTQCAPEPAATEAPQQAERPTEAIPKVDENVQPVDGSDAETALLG